MIDLSYKPKQKPEKVQPEEIVCAVIAIGIMVAQMILFVRAL